MLLTRAPVRIGFDRAHARDAVSPLVTNRHVTPPPGARHIVEQNLTLLGPLGISATEPPEFPLPAFADAEVRAAAWREAHGLTLDRRIVVLLPSTRGEAKRWPAASYRELGRRLLTDENVRLLILGGPGEESILEEVRQGLPPARALVWAPAPIPDLVAMLRHPHLVVGNDTGPLHVAAGSGIPSLGLFGPTQGARNGPYGPHCAFLQSPTGRMTDLRVDEVFAAARRLAQEGDGFRFVDNSEHSR
jgi:ADP-heptose:LPS heptosyltransferase